MTKQAPGDDKAAMLIETKPEPIRSCLLADAERRGIRHGFFTRIGGVSDGIYGTLNIGTGSSDDRSRVAENRRRVALWMGVAPDALLTAHQIHSADVVVARDPFSGDRPKADALVTDRPGIAVGASTADCGPVLFADPEARIIAAAHAGWKGAFGGVLENTVSTMIALGASSARITAVLGPSIGPASYEVGPEFMDRFVQADTANDRFFRPSAKDGHLVFDLPAYILHRLRRADVQVEVLGRCTYAEEKLFYSYRRSVHRGEADYGRQISAIVMEDD